MNQDCDHCCYPLLDSIPDHVFIAEGAQVSCGDCGQPYTAQWDCDGIEFIEAEGPKASPSWHEEMTIKFVEWLCHAS